MLEFFGLIVVSIVTESVVDIIKDIFVDKHVAWQKVMSIILGVIVAIGFGLDLFIMFGMSANIPYLGVVLTGLLISRGANYVSDIIKRINDYKKVEVDLE